MTAKGDHVKLDCFLVPFGMPPADEIQAINTALQERGLDASNIISVRATGTPEEGVMVYFRYRPPLPYPQPHGVDCPICLTRMIEGEEQDFYGSQYAQGFCPLCNFELPQYGNDPYCPKCMAFLARNERPQCVHGFFPYGDVPYCPECMAENAQVK